MWEKINNLYYIYFGVNYPVKRIGNEDFTS